MSLLSSNGAGILAPEDIQALVVQPLSQVAVSLTVSTLVTTGSHSTRFPIVVTDPATGWTAEGQPINVTDPVIDEIDCIPSKLAGLTVVSSELVADSDPSALDVVGQGLVRDLQTKLDAAYFGDTVTHGPSGLESLTGVAVTNGSFDGTLDVFAEAISITEQAGVSALSADGTPNLRFVLNPLDLLTVTTAKTNSTDSNQTLLGPDASAAGARTILGVPALASPHVEAGHGWLIPRDRVFVVLRDDPRVEVDGSAFFESDRQAIRAVLRVGFAHPHQAAIVRVIIDGGS